MSKHEGADQKAGHMIPYTSECVCDEVGLCGWCAFQRIRIAALHGRQPLLHPIPRRRHDDVEVGTDTGADIPGGGAV